MTRPRQSHRPLACPLPEGPALRYRVPSPRSSRAPAALTLALAFLAGVDAHAGDILRGGATLGQRSSRGTITSGLPPGTEQARLNARDALARTTAALNSVKLMQDAARQAALKGPNNLGLDLRHPGQNLPNVPDGLGRGGLQVAAGVPKNLAAPQTGEDGKLWQGALLPKQRTKDGRTLVSIEQLKPQAVLNWETFNVGKKTTLTFEQGRGGADKSQWIAFNKVNDPSASPSQILGKIEGAGQVYVINANGIMFGGSSQINLHALVASSLAINDTLVSRGLLNNPDNQFLFAAPGLTDAAKLPAADPQKTQSFSFATNQTVLSGTLTVTAVVSGVLKTFVAGKDFTVAKNAAGRSVLTFSDATIKKYPALDLSVAYVSQQPGDIIVQKGATISAPTSASSVGGRVVLVGPNVQNHGTISTPDGQTILAAGYEAGFFAHASSDPSLRGLDVQVGRAGLGSGVSSNTGLIDAPRANTTIAGREVDQLGVINSSTSVALNGSVNLQASYGAIRLDNGQGTINVTATRTGLIQIGENSVTQILPEFDNPKTVVGNQLALRSKVTMTGRNIHFGTDSTLFAPNADVALNAGEWGQFTASDPRTFVYTNGQIYFDSGAILNVAGTTDVLVDIAQNILSLELRGSELADSPLQRQGPLRAVTLNLDIRKTGVFNGKTWVGTPLGDATGYANLIERSVAELTTAGGSVTMHAGTSVVMQPGSKVDVSGGYVNFQGGMVKTTQVMSDGRIVDIANATPDRPFTGIYDGTFTTIVPKYGVTQTWSHPLSPSGEYFDPGYIDGRAGGKIAITAASVALDGELLGRTVAGPRQRTAAAAPKLSALALSFEKQDPDQLNPFTGNANTFFTYSPTPPAITFGEGTLPAVGDFKLTASGDPAALPDARLTHVILSPRLFTDSGFGSLTVSDPDGNITIPDDVTVNTPARGSLTLTAANLTVRGSVSSPGGSLTFTTTKATPYQDHKFDGAPKSIANQVGGRGTLIVENGVTLSTAGLIVDDRPLAAAPLSLPLALDGGSISLRGFDVVLAEGTTLDASGGVVFAKDSKRTYGAGGSISIKAGNDANLPQLVGGSLELGSTLRALSGTKGGSLTIQAPSIVVSSSPTPGETSPHALVLTPEFFSQGGFTSFSLIGLGEHVAGGGANDFFPAIDVRPGTQLKPVALSWNAVPYGPAGGGPALSPVLQPQGLRAPVSLSFTGTGLKDNLANSLLITRGDVVIGEGAHVETDPLGSISLTGDSVAVLGQLVAPGGSVSVAMTDGLDPNSVFSGPLASLTTIYLGPRSVLSAKGTVLYTPNPYGFHTGSVLPGGRVSVSGNIVAEAGAVLDVSGASGIVDVPQAMVKMGGDVTDTSVVAVNSGVNQNLYTRQYVPTLLESDAGEISLAGAQHLFTDATLLGNAGGPTALGGTLSVSSGRYFTPNTTASEKDPLDITLQVTQGGSTLPAALVKVNGSPIGVPVFGVDGQPVVGLGHFTADAFARGGFDALNLRNTVEFAGPVSITARRSLSVASSTSSAVSYSTGGVIYADGDVHLKAPYVVLGTPFLTPLSPTDRPVAPFINQAGEAFKLKPAYGPGTLTVQADLIDVGNLSLQNIGAVRLFADGGDIRGDGTLSAAGSIELRAAQIYPPTAVTFTIAASDYTIGSDTFKGSVTIEGSGLRELPLSAGGQLNIYGSIINQRGTLRAPLGGINLGWDGTGDAPINPLTREAEAATQSVTLGSSSITSVSAISPLNGQPLTVPFGLNVNGVTWIDPTGVDITSGGVAQKTINIAGRSVNSMAGSQIDIRGGGDLYAFRWVSGIGGSKDVLASTTSFAVLPAYGSDFSPYAPFSSASDQVKSTAGYFNASLKVGDRVHLGASEGLPEGDYTLLPARYALLPGAFLVTPKAGTPIGKLTMPDGSEMVPGYRFNDLNSQRELNPQLSWFEVLTNEAVRQRSEYADYYGNDFLFVGALNVEANVPRLPRDAGHLTLQASTAMILQGTVAAQGSNRSRGGLVDIASPVDIVITADGGTQAGKLVLSASQLNSFGAESLLIGGIRSESGRTATVSVKTGNLTVDNAGSPLKGPEIILVANKTLTLADGAQVLQQGKINGGADALVISGGTQLSGPGDSLDFTRSGASLVFPNGTPGTDRLTATSPVGIINPDGTTQNFQAGVQFTLQPGARITLTNSGKLTFVSGTSSIPITLGDGALLRVSSDASAQISRQDVASTTQPNLVVGDHTKISGASVILDSTAGTSLSSSAVLDAGAISLNSGQVSIQLDPAQPVNPGTGLVLAGTALQSLTSAQSLSLLSYSTLDVYGAGNFTTAGKLALHAGAIQGFNNGGIAKISAGSLLLDNAANITLGAAPAASTGALEFHAGAITLGKNQLAINRFSSVLLDAASGVVASGKGGLSVQNDLTVDAPVVTATRSATQSIKAGGALVFTESGVAGVSGGLGASLELQGASITSSTNFVLSSGLLKIHATTGDLTLNGDVNLAGTAQTFYDLVRYTSGGRLELAADLGSVSIGSDSLISVSAPAGGGNAGTLLVSAPKGSFTSTGKYSGDAGHGGMAGTFSLDVGSLPDFATLEQQLVDGGFSESQSFRVRTGDVTLASAVAAHHFTLSTDLGGITVSGNIDASGVRGGSIELHGATFVTLANGGILNVGADEFDAAGKGGSVFLDTGTSGTINVLAGSQILLGGALQNDPAHGHFTGTLHLRAPQISGNKDVAVSALGGTITGASAIVVEGYKVVDLASTGGSISTGIRDDVMTAGNTFVGANGGAATPSYTAMLNRIIAGQTGFDSVLSIRPGTEFINTGAGGNITLGTNSTGTGGSQYSNDWNLSTFRFGPHGTPGLLTIRASGNLSLFNSISDGFQSAAWNSLLSTPNADLPLNAQSWSYRFTAGADLTAADAGQVRSLASLATDVGSFILGKDSTNSLFSGSNTASMANIIAGNHFQVVRTGSGDISISAGRDVQIRNQLSSIYTAGTRLATPDVLPDGGSFDVPNPITSTQSITGTLGPDGRGGVTYPAQYTVGGGNITLFAQNDIAHFRKVGNSLLADSSREMPTNWLYRRGNVDPVTGQFSLSPTANTIDSTTWWVDFSNFFEGVGALGGGNVSLTAGHDVSNVDAVSATNARMAKGTPDASKLIELGGGDVVVRAGHDIDGGVYYVERGRGTLSADGSIHTNNSRTTRLGSLSGLSDFGPESTWLPTTLFLGKGGFEVSARGDLLLGQVANPFLLPAGYYNGVRYKTYFSTYAPEDEVNVSSLGGNVSFRLAAVRKGEGEISTLLESWYANHMRFLGFPTSSANYQPWLLIDESDTAPFGSALSLMPGTLRATAFSGDVNVVGNLTLSPSATGTLELVAAKAVNGLNIVGPTADGTGNLWASGSVRVSDSSPLRIATPDRPLGFQSVVPAGTSPVFTNPSVFENFNALFKEDGDLDPSLDRKQAWHAPGLLHTGDASPLRIYAGRGDLSGLAVFSPKAAHILAGRDITDVALFIQNVADDDVSIISAGRDLIAYTSTSPRRSLAQSPGNQLTTTSAFPLSGDLQIAGPGTLEVLAGRDLDLGSTPIPGSTTASSRGPGLGIVSIGNARNTFLPFAGADLVVAAGLGPAMGLSGSGLDFDALIAGFISGPSGSRYQSELTTILGGSGSALDFKNLDPEKRDLAALQIYYLILRDAGRDFNNPDSPGFNNYDNGFAATAALFPGTAWKGDISLTSREIKTKSGGDVSIATPGGKVVVGFDVAAQALEQGILTESGGSINIFASNSVTLGTSRIFTLRGGNEIIWSSTGDIAAGVSSKTVQSAPPTRVLIDPQSADVKTDLAGLATGGGIGVLTTVAGIQPGDVDLIAPAGAIDAGDAGIRSAGNLNVAAKVVLNAENIQVSGASVGAAPAAPPAAPSLSVAAPPPPAPGQSGTPDAANAAKAAAGASNTPVEEPPSIITVEVLGYGGGDGTSPAPSP